MSPAPVGQQLLPIDWGKISPLRLQAKLIADGRGAGVEFGGQRPYVPGDDLRFLDLRSLLRHDRLMVRQFETDTERAVWLCLDASASMAFRGPDAPGAKLAYAALLAAAITRVAIAGQDPIGLAWIAADAMAGISAGFGQTAFERIVSTLERAQASGGLADREAVERCAALLGMRAGRGSVVIVFSDLLDLPPGAVNSITALATAPRGGAGARSARARSVVQRQGAPAQHRGQRGGRDRRRCRARRLP